MKPNGNTSVRELLGDNKFSTKPDRDYTDETYKRIVETLGSSEDGEIKQKVPFAFSKEEKVSIYQDLKFRLQDGQDPDEIARDVLACMEDHMKEKQAEAYGESNSKLKGGKGKFRRVE
jgi:hypothetical protein